MSKGFSFVPALAFLLVGSGAAAAWSGFNLVSDYQSDAFYTRASAQLNTAASQAILLADKAASDSQFTEELAALETEVSKLQSSIRGGDPQTDIKPPPQEVLDQLNQFNEAWDLIASPLGRLVESKSNTEAFSRSRRNTLDLVSPVPDKMDLAIARATEIDASKDVLKSLKDAAENAKTAVLILQRENISLAQLKTAEAALTQYVSILGTVGSTMPRDKGLMDILVATYRDTQSATKEIIKAIDTVSGTSTNLPLAKEIWSARDRIQRSSTALAEVIARQPATRIYTPKLVFILGSLALSLSIVSFFVVLYASKNREQSAEKGVNQIMTSQQERSKALALLAKQAAAFGDGHLDVRLSEDHPSTKEIATVLNPVLDKIQNILMEVEQTIIGLSAAAEQTMVSTKSVDRNKHEMVEAISHVSMLISKMVTFINQADQLASNTASVTLTVSTNVQNGAQAVNAVHEGISTLATLNMSVQHRSKSLIESFQEIDQLGASIENIGEKCALVAYNAHLVANHVTDQEVLKRVSSSAQEMEKLAKQCKLGAADIKRMLRQMHDGARDTQQAVEKSNSEIDKLFNLSKGALSALEQISTMSNSLHESVDNVTGQTKELTSHTAEVQATMQSIEKYASENSQASQMTADAISNLNAQSQSITKVLATQVRRA